MKRVVVIGLGNPFRSDDAAGIEVARRIRDAGPPPGVDVRIVAGDPLGLLDAWAEADTAFVVDAVVGSGEAGALHRHEVDGAPLPDRPRRDSTHVVGLGELIELARALKRLPRRVVVVGIEGRSFVAGTGISNEVSVAVAEVVEWIFREAVMAANRGAR